MFTTQNKLSIVCPLRTNDGRDLTEEISMIRDSIARLVCGCSAIPQCGVWYDGRERYEEHSVVLYTLCTDSALEELSSKFGLWATILEQIELMVMVETCRVAFVQGIRTAKIA